MVCGTWGWLVLAAALLRSRWEAASSCADSWALSRSRAAICGEKQAVDIQQLC